MSRDLRELLHDTAASPTRQLDASEVVDTAHRRSVMMRAGTAIGTAVVALLAAVAVIQVWDSQDAAPQIIDQPPAEQQSSSVDDLVEALTVGIDQLGQAEAVEGTQWAYIDGNLGGTVWFDHRPDGETVVVQQRDRDVVDSGWWLVDDEPPAVGEHLTTTIWVAADGVVYEATLDNGEPTEPWAVLDAQQAPRTLALGVAIIEGQIRPQSLVPSPDGDVEVTRGQRDDGTTVWTLVAPYEDGQSRQQWEIHADGHLAVWSHELVDVTVTEPIQQGAFPATATRMELRPIDDPHPIQRPEPGTAPDPGHYDLPQGP